MHEMAIGEALLEQITAQAQAHGAAKVIRIEVELGEMQQVVPEALRLALEALAEDTVAEGAELVLTDVPLRLRCRGCGHEYHAEPAFLQCPACGLSDAEILAGNDIILKSLTCEAAEAV